MTSKGWAMLWMIMMRRSQLHPHRWQRLGRLRITPMVNTSSPHHFRCETRCILANLSCNWHWNKSSFKTLSKRTKFTVLSCLDNLVKRQDLDALLEASGFCLLQLILNIDNSLHQWAFVEQRLKLGQQIMGGDNRGDFRFGDAWQQSKILFKNHTHGKPIYSQWATPSSPSVA